MFQTARTTFWTRHDPSVNYGDSATAKTPGEEVAEEVASTEHGRRLELTLLVNNAADSGSGDTAVEKDDIARQHRPSGHGIKPECMS